MPETNNPFDDAVVDAVLRHMNGDHAADSVLICRVFAGRPDASAATMVGLDGLGADFRVEGPDGTSEVRVAWSAPIAQRAEIRAEVARLYHEAVEALERR